MYMYKAASLFGTQGHVHCSCTGTCMSTGRGANCKCKKAGLECNSRCHPKNAKKGLLQQKD